MGGTWSMLRGLGRGERRARKEFSVRETHSPLSMSFGIRANDTATSAESESEDRDEPDDNRGIEHLLGTIESSGACIYRVDICGSVAWHSL